MKANFVNLPPHELEKFLPESLQDKVSAVQIRPRGMKPLQVFNHAEKRSAKHQMHPITPSVALTIKKAFNVSEEKPLEVMEKAFEEYGMSIECLTIERKMLSLPCLAAVIKRTHAAELVIADNDFTSIELAQIKSALEENASIRTLNLSNNALHNNGAKQIGKILAANKTLRSLVLQSVQFGDENINSLLEGLEKNNSLEELFLDDTNRPSTSVNHLRDASMYALSETLLRNTTLRKLTISPLLAGSESMKALFITAQARNLAGCPLEIVGCAQRLLNAAEMQKAQELASGIKQRMEASKPSAAPGPMDIAQLSSAAVGMTLD